jgi:hypothetical protein
MHSHADGMSACATTGIPRRTSATRAPRSGLRRRPTIARELGCGCVPSSCRASSRGRALYSGEAVLPEPRSGSPGRSWRSGGRPIPLKSRQCSLFQQPLWRKPLDSSRASPVLAGRIPGPDAYRRPVGRAKRCSERVHLCSGRNLRRLSAASLSLRQSFQNPSSLWEPRRTRRSV